MKIVVAPCSYRYLDKRTAWALGKLYAYNQNGLEFFQTAASPDAAIDRARSQIATDLLKRPELDAVLFIDDDITFDPKDMLKLVSHLQEGKNLVGAGYVTKSDPPFLSSRLFEGQKIAFTKDSPAVKIMYLAGGCMLVGRKVLERLANKLPLCFAGSKSEKEFYPFFATYMKKNRIGIFKNSLEWLSEDYAFCDRAADAGFDVWLDPSIRLGHVGPYEYTLADILRFREPAQDASHLELARV